MGGAAVVKRGGRGRGGGRDILGGRPTRLVTEKDDIVFGTSYGDEFRENLGFQIGSLSNTQGNHFGNNQSEISEEMKQT